MTSIRIFAILAAVLFFTGCQRTADTQSRNTTPPTSAPAGTPVSSGVNQTSQQENQTQKPALDVCALLTSAEIQAVQGESVKETKLTKTAGGGFGVSQCFYTLPTFNNSISLSVTQKGDGKDARDPRAFWRETFHHEKAGHNERGGEREAKEEDAAPPQKVSGVGEEAFWMGSGIAGALYVLKGNSYARISIGGAGDQSAKIKKSKMLAEKVVERL